MGGFGLLGLLAAGGGLGVETGAGAAADAAVLDAMLSRYVMALRDRDFEGAMHERCEAAQVPDEERETFMFSAVVRVAVTGITGARVVDRDRLHVSLHKRVVTKVGFDYVVTANGVDSKPMLGTADVEGDRVRFCGEVRPASDLLGTKLSPVRPAGPSPSPSGPLDTLLPKDPLLEEGYALAAERSRPSVMNARAFAPRSIPIRS